MKVFALIFSILLLLSCNKTTELKDHEIIELPIEIINNYGPFKSAYISFDWQKTNPENPWNKTMVETKGIPGDWGDFYINQIWLNSKQFIYQNYKKDKISKEMFQQIGDGWNVKFEESRLTPKEIKCFVSVIYTKDESGKILYIVDSNNNHDFSDDKIHSPTIINRDILEENTIHTINYETKIGDEIELLKASILIGLLDGENFCYSYPQHAVSKYKNKVINISSGLADIAYSLNSSIINDNSKDVKLLNNYLTLDNTTFKNFFSV